MSKTIFQIYLESTELPVSSFNFASNASGESGSIKVEGLDYLEFISDNQETGTVTLYQVVDGVSTEILTAGIDTLAVAKGPTNKSITITLADVVLSGSIPASFEVDDLTAFEQLQNGFWSFRLPYIAQGYQTGMAVDYLGVERYILSVSAEWTGASGTTTLTEGAQPPDDDSVDGDPGLPSCTYEVFIGTPSAAAFGSLCSSGYGDIGITYISPEGYTYDMFVFICRQFTVPAEADIQIQFSTLRPALDSDDIATGFEFDLIQGEYTPFTNPSPTLYTYRGSGEFNGTLPAGIYTCRLTLYIDRDVNPVSWKDSSYYLYVKYN